jgi:hypothetical protein
LFDNSRNGDVPMRPNSERREYEHHDCKQDTLPLNNPLCRAS